jgi:hypothetical protein
MARIFDKINNVAFSAERIQQEGKEKGGEQPSKVSLRENGISFFLSSLSYICPSSISDQYNSDVSVIWKVYMEKVDLLSTCI